MQFDNREDLEVIRQGGEATEKEFPTASFPEHDAKVMKRVMESQTKVKKLDNSSAKDPAEMSKHETIEIKMEDAKKVAPKHEAIRSSNENSDIVLESAARDVLEEKTKPVSPSEKGSAEMSKSDIRMDDVKRVTQNHEAKRLSNEKPEIDSADATRTVSKQNEITSLKEKKAEIRKEELKGTLQKHDIAGSPQNCKISTPKPGGSVSDKSFDHRASPESKSHKVTELFRGNDEEKYQAEASKCNWLSKWSKKSRYKKGNAAGHQRGIVDEQESGYCGNLCSEQQLKEFQDNIITTMKRVWNYRHKILNMQNSDGSSNNCGSSFTEDLHQFYGNATSVTRRVFDCSGDSCYTNSKNWDWFNNALSARNTNTNPTHFKTVHSLFS